MTIASTVVTATIKRITRILCRVNQAALDQVPAHGPLILVVNHINFLDVPVVYTHLHPRPVTGFVKTESWDNPAMAYLFNLWGAIPIRRGEADIGAYHRGLRALREGKIIAVAPEGTRSGHGRLQCGLPGIVTLAMRSNAPLLPLVYYGNEQFRYNIARLRRTDFHIKVGRPFTIAARGLKLTQPLRQAIADEVMYQLAMLLPPSYRGVYSDLQLATQDYLSFLD